VCLNCLEITASFPNFTTIHSDSTLFLVFVFFLQTKIHSSPNCFISLGFNLRCSRIREHFIVKVYFIFFDRKFYEDFDLGNNRLESMEKSHKFVCSTFKFDNIREVFEMFSLLNFFKRIVRIMLALKSVKMNFSHLIRTLQEK
jgi:hypothetical protein